MTAPARDIPVGTLPLGDMIVSIDGLPGKMLKALAVIAGYLHESYDELPDVTKGHSKQSCLFSSLAARDFLVEIGFKDATVRPCGLIMRADGMDNKELHSLGIGIPGDPPKPEKFNGHAVVTVPQLKLLIDTTLYQAIRPAWGGALTGMIACEYFPPASIKMFGRSPFAGGERMLRDRVVGLYWLDRPELRWRREPDFKRTPRRAAVTRALIEHFGEWRE
jgi:hypothetical protein